MEAILLLISLLVSQVLGNLGTFIGQKDPACAEMIYNWY